MIEKFHHHYLPLYLNIKFKRILRYGIEILRYLNEMLKIWNISVTKDQEPA
jgi:hypothetical protein